MTRSEVLAELRTVIDDTLAPYGWSDARLMNFLALGQIQFCKDTGFFRDVEPLATVPGQEAYLLPSKIIKVLSMWKGNDQLPLTTYTAGLPAAEPVGYALNLSSGSITLTPPPDAVYALTLRVWRSPALRLDHKTANVYDAEMEIPEDFHLAPMEWAAAKCFGDHDRERQDPVKAADHLQNYKTLAIEGKRAFRRICGEQIEIVPSPLYLV